MNFIYDESKARILEILSSKTEIEEVESIPKNENEFTYENGIKSWVGALFIDIRDSTNYFKNNKEERVARVIRAFCSEIVTILKQNDNYRQIGIRGDCVYAIYSVTNKEDLEQIFSDAIFINTFQKMFQKILKQNNFPTFKIGIGLGCSNDLIIKAGKKNSGINDYIWIGNAVVDASKLSGLGNKNGFKSIVLDSCFYSNISDKKANEEHNYSYYISKNYSTTLGEYVYHCEMINIRFNDWIDENL